MNNRSSRKRKHKHKQNNSKVLSKIQRIQFSDWRSSPNTQHNGGKQTQFKVHFCKIAETSDRGKILQASRTWGGRGVKVIYKDFRFLSSKTRSKKTKDQCLQNSERKLLTTPNIISNDQPSEGLKKKYFPTSKEYKEIYLPHIPSQRATGGCSLPKQRRKPKKRRGAIKKKYERG